MNIKRFFTKAVLTMTICSVTICGLSGCGNKNANVTDDKGRTIVTVGGWPTKEGTEKQNIEERKQKFEADNTDFVIQPDNWAFDLKSFYAKAAG